ncbi:dihydrodipicolinate synthase family protein [Occultella kanbiaonis]|uniref:dihydrodipicolinate synthase family protein n=1 Tax=Occultella kanbiaonis TaxID=2675754 RepID=UPI0013D54FEF|nr:dihydrodipicolinate synthase family protein [Occultella kanbiaonis]
MIGDDEMITIQTEVSRSARLRGVLAVFQTPFGEDEAVDHAALTGELRWIIDQGADGLVLGMVSEVLRLSDAERRQVVRTAAEVAGAEDVPLIVSVGAESTSVALRRVDEAVELGAAAVMATPPLTSLIEDEQLAGYFGTLLRHSAVPVIVQDASSYVGGPLSIEIQARLHSEFDSQVLFKPESVPIVPTLGALLEATGGRAVVFEGMGGGALLESFPAGIAGSMPGAEVVWAVVALWKALRAGDGARAVRIDEPLREMLRLQRDLDSFIACEKFLLAHQGVLPNRVARGPSSYVLQADVMELLRNLFDRLVEACRIGT